SFIGLHSSRIAAGVTHISRSKAIVSIYKTQNSSFGLLGHREESGGDSLGGDADHRGTSPPAQGDLGAPVVQLDRARPPGGAEVIEQGAIAGQSEADLISSVEAENVAAVQQSRFHRHYFALARDFLQAQSRRLLPLLGLVLKADFVGDRGPSLAPDRSQDVF